MELTIMVTLSSFGKLYAEIEKQELFIAKFEVKKNRTVHEHRVPRHSVCKHTGKLAGK